jgi:hypothetical protein
VSAFAAGLVVGGFVSLGNLRYIAFLLCTRRWNDHWLPWRLGSFLHWCYQGRLLRIGGIGYQFRHRELQDYLTRNPATPLPPPLAAGDGERTSASSIVAVSRSCSAALTPLSMKTRPKKLSTLHSGGRRSSPG